jgi:hypothetical protein
MHLVGSSNMACFYLLRFLGKYLPKKPFRSYMLDEKQCWREKTPREREIEKERDEEEEDEETAEIVYGTKKLKNEIP